MSILAKVMKNNRVTLIPSLAVATLLLSQASAGAEDTSARAGSLSEVIGYRSVQPVKSGEPLASAQQSAGSSAAAVEDLILHWSTSSGGERSDLFNGVVARRSDMASIAVGTTMSHSSGRRDAWVVAFDPSGRQIWSTPVGGSRDDEAFAVTDLSDGSVVFAGATSSEGQGTSAGLVVKLDSAGKVLWQTLIDTPLSDYLYAVSTLSSGDIVVAGSSDSRQALVARLGVDGRVVWQKNIASDVPDTVRDVAVFSNDDILLIGEVTGMLDSDAAISRLSSAGDLKWHRRFGGSGPDSLTGGVVSIDDKIMLIGSTSHDELDQQGWLLSYSAEGEQNWEKTFGGEGVDTLSDIRTLGDQSMVIVGTADATDESQLNSWILRVSDTGDVMRAKRLGSEFGDGFFGLAPRTDGSFVAAGFAHNWQGEPSNGYIAMLGIPRKEVIAPSAARVDDNPPTVFVPGGGKFFTSESSVEMIGNVIHSRPITNLYIDGRPARLLHNGAFVSRVSIPLGVSEIEIEALDDRGVPGKLVVQVTRTEEDQIALAGETPDLDGINFGNFHALIIGNNFYQGDIPPLKTAIKDSTELASVLQDSYGFEVELLLNADRDQIITALNNKSKTLRKDDNLLIYYAGHGIYDEDTDVGYWLPTDAAMDDKSSWILNSTITDTVKGMDAKHVLLMADSCFSGTLLRSTQVKRTGKFYDQMANRTARLVMTSGGVEPVLDGGGDGHSVFARSLLAKLRGAETIIDGTSLYQAIREPVVMSSEQVPQYSNIRFVDSDGGDFLFVKRD